MTSEGSALELLTAVLAHEVGCLRPARWTCWGLFGDIYTDKVPFTLPQFSVFLDIEFGPADLGQSHVIGFRLLDGEGRAVTPPVGVRFDAPRHDPKPRKVMQHAQNYRDVTFRSMGVHHLDIVYRGQTLRRLYLNILPMA